MYPLPIALTLIGMITAGAGRIIAIKVYYQIQIEEGRPVTPLFVTLMYLFGQALSLFVHFGYVAAKPVVKPAEELVAAKTIDGPQDSALDMTEISCCDLSNGDASSLPQATTDNNSEIEMTSADDVEADDGSSEIDIEKGEHETNPSPKPRLIRQGSNTGLTSESKKAVAWVQHIPWYLKPAIPGFLNLCNSALRWACLVYVAASTAEILISGMELVMSALAARLIRKRLISKQRLAGIAIVTVGLFVVAFTKWSQNKEIKEEEQRFFIGNLLIFGQCVFSVLQDLSEEIFMQEAEFPAMLLLGMEGLFGLTFGAPIYFLFFSEEISFTKYNFGFEIGLILLVLVTGILNIRTTEITSSMTRNVWKQFRIMLVWFLGVLVYYLGNSDYLGEPLVFPGSLFTLGGFSIILTGVYFYYSGKK